MAGGKGRQRTQVLRSDAALQQQRPSSSLGRTSADQSSPIPESHSASNNPPTISTPTTSSSPTPTSSQVPRSLQQQQPSSSPTTTSSQVPGSLQQQQPSSSPTTTNSHTDGADTEPQSSVNKRKRTRLPRLAIRGRGEKMRVKITDGRFVGDYARELVSAVGMWIRQPEHCPINVDDYDEIDAEYKTRLRQLIEDHYVLEGDEENVKKAINFQLRKSFSSYRHILHQHFLKFPNADIAKTKPHEYVEKIEDWLYLCNYWTGDKFEKMSKRNKVNRSKQEAGHSNGSVSFAQTNEKAIEKGENVDRISMYFRTHKKKKDQTPTDEASRIAMNLYHVISTIVSLYTSK